MRQLLKTSHPTEKMLQARETELRQSQGITDPAISATEDIRTIDTYNKIVVAVY